jgi:hypothetical protein
MKMLVTKVARATSVLVNDGWLALAFFHWSCSPPFSRHDAGPLTESTVLLLGWSAFACH